jgi:hypothetical protein
VTSHQPRPSFRPGSPPSESTPPGAPTRRFPIPDPGQYRWSTLTGQEVRLRCIEAAAALVRGDGVNLVTDRTRAGDHVMMLAQQFVDFVERPQPSGPMLHVTTVEEVAAEISGHGTLPRQGTIEFPATLVQGWVDRLRSAIV